MSDELRRPPSISPTMDKETTTQRILNLTLEIIYLLTGESFPPVKSGDHVTITVPPCDSLKPRRPNMEKILEATKKLMELLTGEGGLDGDVLGRRVSSWDPPEEQYKEEEDTPRCDPPSPADLRGGIKEEGDIVISHMMEHHVITGPSPAQVKEEVLSPDEGPQKASLEAEFTVGEAVCFKWSVVDPPSVHSEPRPILPKSDQEEVGGKSFFCTECGKCCRSNADLVQHRRVHSGEKPFQCSECGKHFSKQSSLAVHHRTHTGHKPYSCPECGKSFTSRSELTKHCRSHTGLKPFSCPECGKFFTCNSNLFRHKKIHTGEKQFTCSECGKSFLTRSQMTIHERVHTGEKPYACSECCKCFVSSSDLVKHQRSHTGLKPYICPECGKSYVSRSVLTRHQKIHKVEKRFFCTECGMGFVRTSKFVAHIKAHHRPRGSSRTK